MAAAARDGAAVVYAGAHGRGPFGERVRAALRGEGIEVAAPEDPAGDSGFCVALVEPDGERSFVSTVGVEGRPAAGHFAAVEVAAGDVVCVSGYTLHHPQAAAALTPWLLAAAGRATIVFDVSPMVADIPLDGIRGAVDVWTAGEREARALLERVVPGSGPGALEPARVAGELARALGTPALVRVGDEGCWVAGTDEDVWHAAAPRVTAVDASGAGDAHTGVLCAALARGERLADGVTRANLAAAIAVTRRGPATSPSAVELDRALVRD